jgi:hypothetical protein
MKHIDFEILDAINWSKSFFRRMLREYSKDEYKELSFATTISERKLLRNLKKLTKETQKLYYDFLVEKLEKSNRKKEGK